MDVPLCIDDITAPLVGINQLQIYLEHELLHLFSQLGVGGEMDINFLSQENDGKGVSHIRASRNQNNICCLTMDGTNILANYGTGVRCIVGPMDKISILLHKPMMIDSMTQTDDEVDGVPADSQDVHNSCGRVDFVPSLHCANLNCDNESQTELTGTDVKAMQSMLASTEVKSPRHRRLNPSSAYKQPKEEIVELTSLNNFTEFAAGTDITDLHNSGVFHTENKNQYDDELSLANDLVIIQSPVKEVRQTRSSRRQKVYTGRKKIKDMETTTRKDVICEVKDNTELDPLLKAADTILKAVAEVDGHNKTSEELMIINEAPTTSVTETAATSDEIKIPEVPPRKKRLKKHMTRSECPKCSVSVLDIPTHMRRVHADHKQHICPQCNKSFPTRNNLQRHVDGVHYKIHPLHCEYCGKGFNWRRWMLEHIESVHKKNNPEQTTYFPRIYQCDKCNKTFKKNVQLQQHVKAVHENIKNYKCDKCPKTFYKLYHLKVHARTHTGERPYLCSYCGKGFADKGNMDSHIRSIHLHVIPFKCDICQQQFRRKKMLTDHMANGHSKEIELDSKSFHTLGAKCQGEVVQNLVPTITLQQQPVVEQTYIVQNFDKQLAPLNPVGIQTNMPSIEMQSTVIPASDHIKQLDTGTSNIGLTNTSHTLGSTIQGLSNVGQVPQTDDRGQLIITTNNQQGMAHILTVDSQNQFILMEDQHGEVTLTKVPAAVSKNTNC